MFDLQQYLAERRRLTDETLHAVLPPGGEPPVVLHKAMRYAVFSGGKRLRPAVCMAAAEAVGEQCEPARLPAAAIELLHAYTLIHDDLPAMDDDAIRRGKPTCQVLFGEATAILAGDALQALAFETLARAPVPDGCAPNRLVLELAHAAGSRGVVGGQAEDMAAQQRGTLSARSLERIHLRKTADLFRAAVRMGAIAAGAGETELAALTDYGVNLGLAFQIADDLLDAGAKNGKRRETTCLLVYGPDAARRRAEDLARTASEALAPFPPARAEPLRAIADFAVRRRA